MFELDPGARTSGRILAYLDRPALTRRTIVKEEYLGVWGWAWSSAGIREIAAVDGPPRGKISHGTFRPDVAATYPGPPRKRSRGTDAEEWPRIAGGIQAHTGRTLRQM